MKIENYNIGARYFPTIITTIPFTIIWYFLLNDEVIKYIQFLDGIKWVGNIGFFAVMFYLLLLINRTVGKFIFEKVFFDKGNDLPTTRMLIYENKYYSREFLGKIGKKVQEEFGLTFPSQTDYSSHNNNSKKRIIEIVDQIRHKVKNGRLLLQHNIEYGFWRNLIGGMPLLVLVGGSSIYFLYQEFLMSGLYIVSGFVIFGIILLFSSKRLMNQYGEQYAKVLIQEYMGG